MAGVTHRGNNRPSLSLQVPVSEANTADSAKVGGARCALFRNGAAVCFARET